ncbi:hypothetical protein E2562_008329 [Oryza meyeriana var. granulata]|uniref:non-specific serine/threonine protein kinase n=1 Tax=Oryza meyeriana var. granulata TaxID=110450 RepID=A0A6G1DFQ7_9ORYZ|nr:hypothetical protein E2562_008329 [Oryza meyeriana var. granulata]
MSLPRHRRRRLLLLAVAVLVSLPAPGALSQSPNICGTKANGRYVCPECSTSPATETRGASFEANLLRFQQSLAAANDTSFFNATFATAGNAEDTVYGLAMCFADAERSDCAACLAAAAAELPGTRCTGRRDMVLWYAQCLVRYDNASFFGAADTSPARRFDVPNPNNFSHPARLDAARRRLAGRMVPAAASSPLRFAFDDEEVISGNTTLHGLAQCTQDLPADECSRCLTSQMAWLAGCCADMDGVRLNGASCYLRYEFMAFVPGTPTSMAPSPPSNVPGNRNSSDAAGNWNSSRKKAKTYILAGVLSALALLCMFLLGATLYSYNYKKRHGSLPWRWKTTSKQQIETFLQQQQHPRRYSYTEVKRMTRSFADKLGQGGNGVVHKGVLPDGREVAVKMLKETKLHGEEFMNEVGSISRTSHVNVVTLLGFCLEGSRRGLIYEYMPNGSLERYCRLGRDDEDDGGGGRSLGWETLFDITVGIARGLEYLHRGCNAHIVHFDIKPQNILLDREFRPKISDFGLAKLCPQRESTISVSITGARGTVGYIAPEVFSGQVGAVTSKSDVYSYGMMVLDMAGARRSINAATSETIDSSSSSKYFSQCLYDGFDQFCASSCEVDDGEANELVRKMVIVGLWCIRISPPDRPSMSRIIEMLEKSSAELELPQHG